MCRGEARDELVSVLRELASERAQVGLAPAAGSFLVEPEGGEDDCQGKCSRTPTSSWHAVASGWGPVRALERSAAVSARRRGHSFTVAEVACD
jgi:hypothetical protein